MDKKYPDMHVVARFAEFAQSFRELPIPADVLHHAKRAVIDWHTALLPGAVAAPVLGDAAARALVARLWTLERSPTV
jgi:hypothetical protein